MPVKKAKSAIAAKAKKAKLMRARKKWRADSERREEQRLMDVFAGAAMVALILDDWSAGSKHGVTAKNSYKLAEAMVKERRRILAEAKTH